MNRFISNYGLNAPIRRAHRGTLLTFSMNLIGNAFAVEDNHPPFVVRTIFAAGGAGVYVQPRYS